MIQSADNAIAVLTRRNTGSASSCDFSYNHIGANPHGNPAIRFCRNAGKTALVSKTALAVSREGVKLRAACESPGMYGVQLDAGPKGHGRSLLVSVGEVLKGGTVTLAPEGKAQVLFTPGKARPLTIELKVPDGEPVQLARVIVLRIL